ncbi:F510_1955 family glycosylhydrolase [Melghirimyces algeriensis]|uniref:Sortilin, neurotensin receptor 3 n=1 Tax=Melghirimyces algeriensis TaxID=910412 RepID=A0A521EJH3_9BACL|nr:hypothetical protein [Melghirimyces algeriensis]SMO84066.1 hypothetical protein SAMN06264849_109112 [Melghirimyces algeriensis]
MKRRRKIGIILVTVVASLSLFACNAGDGKTEEQKGALSTPHIHGLSYSDDGKTLIAATHHGIYRYQNRSWTGPVGESHDLMGFSYTQHGIFASGHPAEGSNLPDPLGLIISNDEGQSWTPVKFQGESDFHYMTAGFESGAIFVWNEHPNEELETGLYTSQKKGEKWNRVSTKGIDGKMITMDAHPQKADALVVGTDQGVYLKSGNKKDFENVWTGIQATALLHDRKNPEKIWIGTYTDQPHLYHLNIRSKKKKEVPLPFDHTNDAIQFIAQSSSNPETLAISTFDGNIYTSRDGGGTWTQVSQGKGETDETNPSA